MQKTVELREHNELLDDPQAMRRQMESDGYLFFRGLLPADEITACADESCRSATTTGGSRPAPS